MAVAGAVHAAMEDRLGDAFGHGGGRSLVKPCPERFQDIGIEGIQLQFFQFVSDIRLVQLGVMATADPEVDDMAQADAAVAIMLGKMGKQIDKGVLVGQDMAASLYLLRQTPAVSVIGKVVGVIRGNQELMQFDMAFGVLPDKFVVALQFFFKAQVLHDGADLLILLGADEDIDIAHGAHFGFGIDGFEVGPLDDHIVDPALIKGMGNAIQFVDLPFMDDQIGAGLTEQGLDFRVGGGKQAAIDHTVVEQGRDTVLLGDVDPHVKVAQIGRRNGYMLDRAFYNL